MGDCRSSRRALMEPWRWTCSRHAWYAAAPSRILSRCRDCRSWHHSKHWRAQSEAFGMQSPWTHRFRGSRHGHSGPLGWPKRTTLRERSPLELPTETSIDGLELNEVTSMKTTTLTGAKSHTRRHVKYVAQMLKNGHQISTCTVEETN